MTDIRLPNITANADTPTQMAQMRSYLYQMVEQLNWALNALDNEASGRQGRTAAHTDTRAEGGSQSEDGTNQRMANLRDLIIKSAETAQAELENLKKDYKSIASVTEEYYRSASATELTGGEWSAEYPGWLEDTYIWTRSVITYTDGSEPVRTMAKCVTGSPGDDCITVTVTSSRGAAFRGGDGETVLTARVWKGAAEVTDQYDASQFLWTRESSDKAADAAWNTAHFGGTKEVTITGDDVDGTATFFCTLNA